MANKTPYQTTFEPEHVIQPIYTGGSVSLDQTGRILATTVGEDALLTDLSTGKQLAKIEGDGEIISTLTVTPSASHLIICSRSLSMRIYSLKPSLTAGSDIRYDLLRTLKPHATPVLVLAVDKTGTLLATGAADGVVKVWDIAGGFVTHTFRGPNVLLSALHFFELVARSNDEQPGISSRNRKNDRRRSEANEDESNESARGFRLASGSQDGKVRIWDLYKRNCTSILDSHVSDVRALDYSPEENALLTASRDKTIMWWDAKTWKVRRVVPVLEEVEAAGFLEAGKLTYTGGANGNIRIWQSENGREVTQPQPNKGEADAILAASTSPEVPFILSIQLDHTMALHSTSSLASVTSEKTISPLQEIRRISGTHDEIIDLGYLLPDKSLLALATNSEEIRIVSLAEESSNNSTYFGSDVAQLRGHEDIVICLDIDWSGHWIATGAKDNTARLWCIDPANNSFTCHTTFTGHAESLGAIALPHSTPPTSSPSFKSPVDHLPEYLLTGSQDRTVKRWDIPRARDGTAPRKAPRALYTRKAHDKDINALDISHNGEIFASASQDKTVKIWSVEEGEVLGVLRGHRRGVWSVKFAPKDTPSISGESGPTAGKGLILTGSGDKTLKLWSLFDYSCLRTFEGHANSVLKVCWLNIPKPEDRGRKHIQISSAGGDGLVKIWDANTGEVECTLDNHEDRVWALTVNPITNMVISGSGDSTVTFWKDTTESTQAASTAAATQFVEQEQELQNYIHAGSWRSAITLALQLNHPGKLLSLFTSVITTQSPEPDSLSGSNAVDNVLANLSEEQLFTLLLRVRDWNTNNKTSAVAQKILSVIVKSYSAERISNLRVRGAKGTKSLKEIVDALRAYSEKGYKKCEELVDDSFIVEYTLMGMDGMGFLDEGVVMET